MTEAANDFEIECDRFIQRYPKFLRFETSELSEALKAAHSEGDIKRAAELFSSKILAASQLVAERKETFKASWAGKLRNFLTGFYPVVKIGLAITGIVANVSFSQIH